MSSLFCVFFPSSIVWRGALRKNWESGNSYHNYFMFIWAFFETLRSTYIVHMVNHYYPKYSELLNDRSQRILSNIVNQERYAERPIGELSLRTFLSSDVLVTSQGVKDCMTWKGNPLYKSVYDFSLFPIMIWDEWSMQNVWNKLPYTQHGPAKSENPQAKISHILGGRLE